MRLSELLYEMERGLKRMQREAEDYIHIPIVSSFVSQKEADYRYFKEIVKLAKWNGTEKVAMVIEELKEWGEESKFFGGMCLRRAGYFEFNQDVQAAINNEILRQASEKEVDDIHFDTDYAIPDELDNETFERLYGEEIVG